MACYPFLPWLTKAPPRCSVPLLPCALGCYRISNSFFYVKQNILLVNDDGQVVIIFYLDESVAAFPEAMIFEKVRPLLLYHHLVFLLVQFICTILYFPKRCL